MSKDNNSWNKESLQVGVLDYITSTTHVISVNIWYGEDKHYGYISKHDAIEHSLDNVGFKINNIEWMECSEVKVDTNKYTFNRRLSDGNL